MSTGGAAEIMARICKDCKDAREWHHMGTCEICDKIGGPCKSKEVQREGLPGGAVLKG